MYCNEYKKIAELLNLRKTDLNWKYLKISFKESIYFLFKINKCNFEIKIILKNTLKIKIKRSWRKQIKM